MQQINLQCLQENYTLKYWLQQYQQNPEVSFVATLDDKVIAYVVGKIEEEEPHGHIISVACLQQYRHMGLTTRLMKLVHCAMRDIYKVQYCTLHERSINEAAHHLYEQSCGYYESEVATGYFADGEDAFKLTCRFCNLDEHVFIVIKITRNGYILLLQIIVKQIFNQFVLSTIFQIPSLVKVNVYDLSQGQIQQVVNAFGLGNQYGDFTAIYHTGTIVYDKEFYFGGSMDQQVTGGIDSDTPSHTQYGTPIKTLEFGETQKTLDEILEYIETQNKTEFRAITYNIFDHNCNTFTNQFVQFLTGKELPSEYLDQGKRFQNTPIGQLYANFMGNQNQQLQYQPQNNFNQVGHSVQQQPNKQPTPIEKVEDKYKALYIQYPKVFLQNTDEILDLIDDNEDLKEVFDCYQQNEDICISKEQFNGYLQTAKLSTLQKYEIYSLLCTTSCWKLIPENESPINLILQDDPAIKSKEFIFFLINYLSQICGMTQARQNYQQIYDYIINSQNMLHDQQQSLRAYYNFCRILTQKQITALKPLEKLIETIEILSQKVIENQGNKQQLACLNLACAIYGRILITLSKTQDCLSYKAQINQSSVVKLKESKAPAVQQLLKYCKLQQVDVPQNIDEFY